MPFEQIDRLEAGDDDRHAVALRERLVLAVAHDRADVAGAEERLHAVAGGLQDRGDRRRHEHVRDQHREVRHALRAWPG